MLCVMFSGRFVALADFASLIQESKETDVYTLHTVCSVTVIQGGLVVG